VSKNGDFEVTFKEAARIVPSKIAEALPKKFSLATVALTARGELVFHESGDDAGFWFVAKSGQKYLLANRPKKDEKDEPADIVGALRKDLEAGKSQAKVEGAIVEADGKVTIQLEKGEAVEAQK